MNVKWFWISMIGVLAFVFGYEWLVHGILLQNIYAQTAELWRPAGESNMIFMFMSQLGFAAAIAFIFTLKYEGKGMGEGIRFGLIMGMLMGSVQLAAYSYMPISMGLTLGWVLASMMKCVGSGMILSLVYKN